MTIPGSVRIDISLLLSLLLCLLSGCTLLQQDVEAPSSVNWKTHQARLALLQQWTASGKVAVRTAETADSASLVWQQRGEDTDLQLSGPLGVGATSIHSDGRQLDIHRGGEHRTLDISTPDAMTSSTGWDLPIQALSHWLKGLPSPESEVLGLSVDPRTGLLQSLRQDGWEIQYNAYAQFEGFTLPTRLQIKRDTTVARVVIAQWRTVPG